MTSEIKQCAITPHPDIENNYPRSPIPYYIDIPDAGLNEDTGLIFTISGYGAHPSSEYENKLRPYLANKYNCIAVGVDYFGCELKCPSPRNYRFSADFFYQLERVYKIKMDQREHLTVANFLPTLIKAFRTHGVKRVNPALRLLSNKENVYQSFGLLPAMDYLQVLAELMSTYEINKKRLYVLGSSYGGYIGLMLGKLAPKTFQFIVDNSGFTAPRLPDVYGVNGPGGMWTVAGGCEIALAEDSPWVDSPDSPHFFDVHHQEIRSLLIPEHMRPSKTQYYCFHAIVDSMAPTEGKKEFKALRSGNDVNLDIIDENKVDGRVFKNLDHGMSASLRGIFDRSYDEYTSKAIETDSITDFDLNSEYLFPCSNGMTYQICFRDEDVSLNLIDSR